MRRTLALLVISIALLAGSGCARGRSVVSVHHEFTLCPRPQAPDLPEVDPGESLCSPKNLEALLELFDSQRWLIEQQSAALDCYEAQASKGGR